MSFIKMFEEYNGLYKSINREDFVSRLGDTCTFLDKNIERIKNVCIENDIKFIQTKCSNIYSIKSQCIIFYHLNFFEIEDDWILVHIEIDHDDFYYKCDTVDGLEKLIKDKLP